MGSNQEDKPRDQPERDTSRDREERRSHVRVVPTEQQPVRLIISEAEHLVQDLSLGGLAFTPEDLGGSAGLVPGGRIQGRLILPQVPDHVAIALKVMMIEP